MSDIISNEFKQNIINNLVKIANKEGLIYPITKCLDFEKLARDYDAIEVLISNDYRLNTSLMGWDCDSIIVFNPNIIEEVKE